MGRYYLMPFSIASKVVATPLLFAVGFTYVSQITKQSTSEVYPLCMAAFGVTAALAAICFTIPSNGEGFQPSRYAAEKFLHSSILLIQTLMIVYIKTALTQSLWWQAHGGLSSLARGILTAVLIILSGAATFAWFFGFEALNDELWSNWYRRLREMETQKRKSSVVSDNKLDNNASQQIVGTKHGERASQPD